MHTAPAHTRTPAPPPPPQPLYRRLEAVPRVFTLQLSWDQGVSADDIRSTLANVHEGLDIVTLYDAQGVSACVCVCGGGGGRGACSLGSPRMRAGSGDRSGCR
jgi:hypothetical protein